MGSLQNKPNLDGVLTDNVKVVESAAIRSGRPYDALLRLLAVALTLVAVIIVGVNKETKTITIYAGMQFQATAHWQYMSAFVFFLVSNAIACCYGAASLVTLEVVRRSNKLENKESARTLRLAVTTSDIVMTGLLFSAIGAAVAIGVIGQKGNSHVQWMEVCNEFEVYCHHMITAFVLSLLGSTAFLWLVVLSVFRLSANTSTMTTR